MALVVGCGWGASEFGGAKGVRDIARSPTTRSGWPAEENRPNGGCRIGRGSRSSCAGRPGHRRGGVARRRTPCDTRLRRSRTTLTHLVPEVHVRARDAAARRVSERFAEARDPCYPHRGSRCGHTRPGSATPDHRNRPGGAHSRVVQGRQRADRCAGDPIEITLHPRTRERPPARVVGRT